jgi:hypothetical protein
MDSIRRVSNGLWRPIAMFSTGALIAGFGSWVAWVVASADHVDHIEVASIIRSTVSELKLATRDDVIDAIKTNVIYPWPADRPYVLQHMVDTEKHQSIEERRLIFRDEIELMIRPIHQELAELRRLIEEQPQ